MSFNVSSSYYTGSLTVIDLSWFTPYKSFTDPIITGFAYLFFLWRVFVHLPNIVHGSGGDTEKNGGGN